MSIQPSIDGRRNAVPTARALVGGPSEPGLVSLTAGNSRTRPEQHARANRAVWQSVALRKSTQASQNVRHTLPYLECMPGMRPARLHIPLYLALACAGCETATRPAGEGNTGEMKAQDYQEIADMVREDHAQLADIALHHLRDSTTSYGTIGLGCMARADIDQVHVETSPISESSPLADASLSSALRELLIEILGAVEKPPGECPTASPESK